MITGVSDYKFFSGSFEFTGSVTPKNRQKVGVVYGFPAKLGESTRSPIIKPKMAAAAIMKKLKL
jgi:hypothetical protein